MVMPPLLPKKEGICDKVASVHLPALVLMFDAGSLLNVSR
jgi:hypothetical protein